MRVADDVAQNVAHRTARIAQAAEAGAALVCFPEYSLRPLNADWMDLTGAVETVRAACQAHGIWVVFGGESGGAEGLMVQEIDLADLARLRAYYASPAAEGRP